METQNVTLAIRKDLLRKVKLLAVQRQTSLSALLTRTLEQLAEEEDAYVAAQQRHLQWLQHGADLGTQGALSARRDELHGRD
jgi:hypothetical protein